MEELLSLKWNNHRSTFVHILGVLRDKQMYTDATIACDGKFYNVHKLVMSTCSDYFCAMFDKTSCKSPVIVLKDIKCDDLEALLDYMYLGEVNVRQSDLASLIKAAECLRIKGLAVPDDEPPKKVPPSNRLETSASRKADSAHSPPSKRRRRDAEDGRDNIRPSTGSAVRQSPPARPKSLSPHRATQAVVDVDRSPGHPQSSDSQQTTTLQAGPSDTFSSDQQGEPFRQESQETPFVKVEMEDDVEGDGGGDSYDLPNDGYKEEEDGDPGGEDLSNDLPEFLQQATSGPLQGGSGSFSHGSFPGTSAYQSGELPGWQGEGSSLGFPAPLSYGSSDGSSQQNAPGATRELGCFVGPGTSLSLWGFGRSLELNPVGVVGLECPVCQKKFQGRNRRQNLKHHFMTHTGERDHQCPFCPHRTAHKWHLKTHILRRHAQATALLQMASDKTGSSFGDPPNKPS